MLPRASYVATLRPLDGLDPGLRRAWERLAGAALEDDVFFDPAVVLAAAHHLPGGDRVRLLAVEHHGELVLALPVAVGRHRRLPWPVWTTWPHPYRYLGTPLLSPAAPRDTARAALRRLSVSGPGWLALDQLTVDGPVAAAFQAAAHDLGASWHVYDVAPRPVVRRRPGTVDPAAGLSPRSRRSLRRLRRNLERDLGGPVTATEVAGGPDLAAELDRFLALEAAGWKGRAGTALGSSPPDAAFFREACTELAAEGRLELWRLTAGDRVVARQCHVVSGGTVFHLKTTYDERAARYSPGVQLELDVLAAFHADPRLALLESCTAPEPTVSMRLYPDTRPLGVALVGLSAADRVASRVTPVAAKAVRAARRLS